MRPITFLFPGQGSQHVGMGAELFDRYPREVAQADAILGYSIRELCLRDPKGQLSQTQFTQPALYVVNALGFLSAREALGRDPDFLAGHSLGEYNALFAAGGFDFETGLKLVQKRGEIMSRVRDGGMAALVGLPADTVREILARAHPGLDAANFNSPQQTVISGPKAEIDAAAATFQEAGVRMYIPLSVSGAFHSRYMEPARQEFARFLAGFTFGPLKVAVYANVTAAPYPSGQAIPELLCRQITGSVRWSDTILELMRAGDQDFREIGPGKVLRGLVAKITSESPPVSRPSPAAPESPAAVRPAAPVFPAPVEGLQPSMLGSPVFRERYDLKYAYLAGAMYKGIASPSLVIRMGKAGLMGFLGTGGMDPHEIEQALQQIQGELGRDGRYGVNLLCNLDNPEQEDRSVEMYLKYGVRRIEAAAYLQVTPALVRFRLSGLSEGKDGRIHSLHSVIGKVSRPEVATAFLSPAPEKIVATLVGAGLLTPEQARLGQRVPVASDLTIESDSAGHTDQGVALVLLPAMKVLRDELAARHAYQDPVHLGAAGGIGAPEAAAAAFMLGADYIQTGSINQCTVEAGMSDAVKDLLQDINVQDTTFAPAGDMFEIGARVQVLKKGLFFAPRANKLYELYRRHDSIDQIDEKTRLQIQEKYFGRTFEEVWAETAAYLQRHRPQDYQRAAGSPKQKMALIFRWYFVHSSRLAFEGNPAKKLDFQVHCGPALGAFNQWVKGTALASWRNRHADDIAERLMQGAAKAMGRYLSSLPMTALPQPAV